MGKPQVAVCTLSSVRFPLRPLLWGRRGLEPQFFPQMAGDLGVLRQAPAAGAAQGRLQPYYTESRLGIAMRGRSS